DQTSSALPNTCEDCRVLPIVDARVTPERDEVVLLSTVEGCEPGFSGIDQTGVELDATAGGHCLEALEVFAFRRSVGSKVEGATVGGQARPGLIEERFNRAHFDHASDVTIWKVILLDGPIDPTKDKRHGMVFIKRHDKVLRRVVVGSNHDIRTPRLNKRFGVEGFLGDLLGFLMPLGVHVELLEFAVILQDGAQATFDAIRPGITLMVGGDKETLGGPRGMGSAQTVEQQETPPHIALRDSDPCRVLCINIGGTRSLLHRYPI